MTPHETFSALLRASGPLLALAPMQDVTTLEFMRVVARHGGPDVYWTEYFRVHGDSRPERWILDSITKNPTGRPVVAQLIGNVHSAAQARQLLAGTGARGLMIGRGAIRNPWLFDQVRAGLRGEKINLPAGRDVLAYIHELWDNEISPGVKESAQVQRMKKFMNFIGEGVDEKFLFEIRRVATTADFFRVCAHFLDHDRPMPLEPPPVSEAPLDLPASF